MKGIAQIPLIALIGTVALAVGILMPPAIIKTTIDKELLFTYGYEKAQHILLTLFYLSQDGKNGYEILSERALFENLTCTTNADCSLGYACNTLIGKCDATTSTKPLKLRLDKAAGEGYCIRTDKIIPKILTGQLEKPFGIQPSDEVLKRICASNIIQFSTVIVLPYNKESLIKLIRVGVT